MQFPKAVNRAALCIIPPQDLWEPIQQLRKQHDKSFDRWMPHINLLFPFVPEGRFVSAIEVIEQDPEFQKIKKPFRVKLEKFVNTSGSKYIGLHAEVVSTEKVVPNKKRVPKKKGKGKSAGEESEGELKQLNAILKRLFPGCTGAGGEGGEEKESKEWTAHLTVGQLDQKQMKRTKEEWEKTWKPIEWEVTELSMIARDGEEPFTVRKTISLV